MVPQNFRGSGGAGVISALYDDAPDEWLERARDTQPRVARSSAGVSAPNATCFLSIRVIGTWRHRAQNLQVSSTFENP
jgi:hypothetical protein